MNLRQQCETMAKYIISCGGMEGNDRMINGIIFDIKEFTVHDGPGIRTTVFFKGCPLHCVWCHNPEGISFQRELLINKPSCVNCGKCRVGCTHEECKPFNLCTKICSKGLIRIAGTIVDSESLAKELMKQESFFENNRGGITISGGEPLAQPEFLLDLLKRLKPIHTAVETSGYGNSEVFKEAIGLTDIILYDIKHMDPKIHEKVTGVDNNLILSNFRQLMNLKKEFIVRIPLIPGINDSEKNFKSMAEFLKGAKGLQRVEFLPYNTFTGAKYHILNREYKPPFNEKGKIQLYTSSFDNYGIKWTVRKN